MLSLTTADYCLEMFAVDEGYQGRQVEHFKLSTCFIVSRVISVNRSYENTTFELRRDFSEHCIHRFVVQIPGNPKMKNGNVVLGHNCGKLVRQDFARGRFPVHGYGCNRMMQFSP